MKNIIILFLIFLTLSCSGIKELRPKGDFPGQYDEGVFNHSLPGGEEAVTPKGAKVSSRQNINKAVLPEIDAGLDRLFEIARAAPNNYKFTIGHGDFKVWLMPRSSFCEGIGFLVRDKELVYNGTEYDKNPKPDESVICAAGMTIFQGITGTAPGMVVTDDVGQMATIVRYEGEHGLLLFVDQERYFATQFHPPPHPILGDGVASLYGQPPEFQSVTLEGNSVLLTK